MVLFSIRDPDYYHYSPEARSDLLSLNKHVVHRILRKMDWFGLSDDIMVHAKQLKGLNKRFRLRIGAFRVVFSLYVQHDCITLIVLRIRHRRDVYKTGMTS